MAVTLMTPTHVLWTEYVAHLQRTGDARWALAGVDDTLPGVYYFAAVDGQQVIGNITLKTQPITIPATEWNGGVEQPLCGLDGRPLCEMFVQTFSVEEEHQRRGYGRTLQVAALSLARKLDCYQMRSWSSADRTANHALKLEMGFAAHPGIFTTASGQEISGVYFVMTV